jgi:hypothetical protein
MGLFGVKKFAGYTSQSLKEKESADKRLAELEEEKLTGIARLILNSTDMELALYAYVYILLSRALSGMFCFLFVFILRSCCYRGLCSCFEV